MSRRSTRLLSHSTTTLKPDEVVSVMKNSSTCRKRKVDIENDSKGSSNKLKLYPSVINNDNANPGDDDDDDEEEELDNDETSSSLFTFDGVRYATYQDMVQAKRERNQRILQDSGLLTAVVDAKNMISANNKRIVSQNGLQKKETTNTTRDRKTVIVRKSKRLSGEKSDGRYVDHERSGVFTVMTSNDTKENPDGSSFYTTEPLKPKYYNGRLNDGDPIPLSEAVLNTGSKWSNDESIIMAHNFIETILQPEIMKNNISSYSVVNNIKTESENPGKQMRTNSPNSVMYKEKINIHSSLDLVKSDDASLSSSSSSFTTWTQEQLNNLSSDDTNSCVAKVCPERIYGIDVHPSLDKLMVAAGDKSGFVGIWNVDHKKSHSLSSNDDDAKLTIKKEDPDEEEVILNSSKDKKTNNSRLPAQNSDNGVYLFKYHSGAVNSLNWTNNGNGLISTSYDGTVRYFDVVTEQFDELFGVFDDSSTYQKKLGYDMDTGYRYWTQYGCLDHRFSSSNDKCMFLSTSVGTAMHLDLRQSNHHPNGQITFHEELSEKKINSLSLHPNGYAFMSAGLDSTVKVWDLRLLGNNRTTKSKKGPEPIYIHQCGLSANSSFFSPSGHYAVATTMSNKLDILENIHLLSSTDKNKENSSFVPNVKRLYHDNQTGRWLTTFMATFHSKLDLFCVGSMSKPRGIEIFDSTSGTLLRTVSGDAITSVSSRNCFHPRTDKIIIAGGNSSGRVCIVR